MNHFNIPRIVLNLHLWGGLRAYTIGIASIEEKLSFAAWLNRSTKHSMANSHCPLNFSNKVEDPSIVADHLSVQLVSQAYHKPLIILQINGGFLVM